MARALEEYQLLGIKTTIPFYQRIMHDPVFLKGNFTTAFIDEIFASLDQARDHPLEEIALIAAAIWEFEFLNSMPAPVPPSTKDVSSNWKSLARKEGLQS